MNNLLAIEGYDPINLIDHLIDMKALKNDAALCRLLEIPPPMLSKIRKKKLGISGDLLVRVYDIIGVDVDTSRNLAGIPKTVSTPPTPPRRPVAPPASVEA